MKKSIASYSKSLLAGAAAVVLLGLSSLPAKADKGMWIIGELQKENIQRMKELGLKIDPTKMFDLENPGIANAVVIFGGGCTGVTVSNSGLIFTNHHCGYGAIQSQSTVEHDYLQDGFVSKTSAEELPIPGLEVRYLRETIDVTDRVKAAAIGITDEMDRMRAEAQAAQSIAAEYAKQPFTDADVYPFYERNKFYLIIYDVYSDVRLVFAPPSSVGKFGHDSDNWMWPRHTNDFSVFRVYAGKDNRPAEYAKDNQPYKPRYAVPVSLAGVKDKDYAMTIGFPGSTDRYLSSWGVEDRIKNENEPTILVRGIKQDIWAKYMKADQATRIQYASKYAGSSNYWKNFIGMNNGLRRLNVTATKQALEQKFANWVEKDAARKTEFGGVLDSLRLSLEGLGIPSHDMTIISEALSGTELRGLTALPAEDLRSFDADKLFKDFSPTVAQATLPAMLKVVKENVQARFLPDIFAKIDKEFGGNYGKYATYVFDNSVFVQKDRLVEALKNYDALKAAYASDPAVELVQSFQKAQQKAQMVAYPYVGPYYKGRRLFYKGLKEMMPDTPLPSDANFTMRLSYGSVGGYKPYDAGWYDYYTTQQGVFEKQDPNSDEYRVQPEILKLLADKSTYGQYADPADGNLHTCFISNNDITGGNSGSPVFNGNGELIGLAFDGNWEAMSGDIEFEPNLQRTISVDIRYVLYFIDVWGGADRLMKELTLVK